MGDEKAEIPAFKFKCQGQVSNIRLPLREEDTDRGMVSTVTLISPEAQHIGYLYLRHRDGPYNLGFVFEVEVALRQIPPERFYANLGGKQMPKLSGVDPV